MAPALACAMLGCSAPSPGTPEAPLPHALLPVPAEVDLAWADTFHLTDQTRITHEQDNAGAEHAARTLARLIGNTVETTPVVAAAAFMSPGDIHFGSVEQVEQVTPGTLDESYSLSVSPDGVQVRAPSPAGHYYAAQTLRQLLPPLVEYSAAYPHPLYLPTGTVRDRPRYAWRGLMLDVARHYLPPRDIQRFIDLMALHKLNRLHLHLADDQGWRIEIPEWPALTEIGGSTEVGGGEGGFYTADDYRGLVRYAEERFITIVPEIDVPGHTNAALASYPELNCDGAAPDLYTGTDVGFSVLCVDKDITYRFLDDVIGEISRLTTGAWFHVGGDEVKLLSEADYVAFIERVQGLVESHGKAMIGWDEIASASLSATSTVQLWRPLWPSGGSDTLEAEQSEAAAALAAGLGRALEAGAKVILSPADRIYLDMKYSTSTPVGLTWAAVVDVRSSYDWRVAEVFGSVPEASILGVEAPLWSETVGTREEFEYLAFPRLASVAEIGWSPAAARSWEEFRLRLGAQSPRWTALGVNFNRTPDVPWAHEPVQHR